MSLSIFISVKCFYKILMKIMSFSLFWCGYLNIHVEVVNRHQTSLNSIVLMTSSHISQNEYSVICQKEKHLLLNLKFLKTYSNIRARAISVLLHKLHKEQRDNHVVLIIY